MLTIGAPSRLHGLIERLRAIAQLSAALDSIAVETNRSRRNAKFTFPLDDDCYDLLLSRTIFQAERRQFEKLEKMLKIILSIEF